MSVDLDIGVVSWNTRQLTVDALRRLVDSDQGCRFHLLVRDNGSTDGTPAAVREWVPEAELEVGENIGFAAGMNRLLARSSAPWFLALNPDAWPEPGAVGRLLATARSYGEAAAVAPRIERPDGTLEHSTHPFPSLRMALLHALGGRLWLPPKVLEREMLEGFWDHDRARPVDWAVGAALLLRRSVVDEIGGFDERFFMYAEDMEWCWRAHHAGYDVIFEPASLFRHVGNASGAQAYGPGRIEVETESALRFHRLYHGRFSTAAYRLTSAAAAAEVWAGARLRRDHAEAGRWSRQARAWLRRPGPSAAPVPATAAASGSGPTPPGAPRPRPGPPPGPGL